MTFNKKAQLLISLALISIIFIAAPFALSFPGQVTECSDCHTSIGPLQLSSNATGTVQAFVGVPFILFFDAPGAGALSIQSGWANNSQFSFSTQLVEDNSGGDLDPNVDAIEASITITPLSEGSYTIRVWSAAAGALAVSLDVPINASQNTGTTITTTPTGQGEIDKWFMTWLIMFSGMALVLIVLSIGIWRRATVG
ncbi:MAG: hypothetical protein ACE5H4_08095 [Candidatus Thorarchaeota archaeon]